MEELGRWVILAAVAALFAVDALRFWCPKGGWRRMFRHELHIEKKWGNHEGSEGIHKITQCRRCRKKVEDSFHSTNPTRRKDE